MNSAVLILFCMVAAGISSAVTYLGTDWLIRHVQKGGDHSELARNLCNYEDSN